VEVLWFQLIGSLCCKFKANVRKIFNMAGISFISASPVLL
jgi:hypothetical protein